MRRQTSHLPVRRWISRASVAALCAAVSLVGASCVQRPESKPRCILSAKGRGCGVILGIATSPATNAQVAKVELSQPRPFDMVYRFTDLAGAIPTSEERSLVAHGTLLHLAVDARFYGAPHKVVRWKAVTAGAYDSILLRDARGVAALKVPVFVTFDHEPDLTQHAASGSPAAYVAAWRHVHELFTTAGATNAVWVWVVSGYQNTFGVDGRFWPGNRYVDWISWEAYNASGCRTGPVDPQRFESFSQSVLPFYTWLILHGRTYGIDTRKPMMISEAASAVFRNDPLLTRSWYDQIPGVLAAHPDIRAITLWDRPGSTGCPYQFDSFPTVMQAIRNVALNLARHGRPR